MTEPARWLQSPQWRNGQFQNRLPRNDGSALKAALQFFVGGSKHRTPTAPMPVERRVAADYATPPTSGLRVTWLGHSTLLFEMGGRRILTDPLWGERASPFEWFGPKRYHAPPLTLDELPPLDAVLISHDHYDHLQKFTIERLRERVPQWITPLRVGDHLRAWGVPAARITELDWWQPWTLGDITITPGPARHFSGRRAVGSNQTLWASWAFHTAERRLFYSADSAMHNDYAEIGERLGPFDLTLVEIGAYNAAWADVHMGPEQAVRAHQSLRGKLMLPIHWGTFDLALHGWTEPIERTLVAARAAGVDVVTPRPGGRVEPGVVEPRERWWPEVPWETAEQAPVVSSGLAG